MFAQERETTFMERAADPGHDEALLDEIARRCGIQPHYHDMWGRKQDISATTKRRLLAAMGFVAEDRAALSAVAEAWLRDEWARALPEVQVVRVGDAIRVPLTLPDPAPARQLGWVVEEEYGAEHRGEVSLDELTVLARRDLGGEAFARFELIPRVSLPLGYHELRLYGATSEPAPLAQMALYMVPARCYEPEVFSDERRLWGPAVQLYGVRSAGDWGIGDLGSVAELVSASKQLGAHVVGLNPLHALFPHRPAHASPYSPSSRLFLNVLYIDVQTVAELDSCEEAQRTVRSASFRQRLARVREAELVDYVEVARLKRPLLEQLYEHFRAHHLALGTERARAFRTFQRERGDALIGHALYEALQEHFHRTLGIEGGWLEWPTPYRHPLTEAVGRFACAHRQRVEFFQYLQWLADEQLACAAERARAEGLAIGLYLDYAVSVDRAGAEVWANQDVYALGASAGAPPDDFSLQGQDWGLPPMSPAGLRKQRYLPFIAGLRQNMRHAGALRIDHVMGLMRLFWVPVGGLPAEGAYVHYPFEDLMGIVALESQRGRCLVIGEDLGTVPDEVRQAMRRFGMLSYCPLLFERAPDGTFKEPSAYPRAALVSATTHDLPTLQGYWTGRDVQVRAELGLLDQAQAQQQLGARAVDRVRLVEALCAAGLIEAGAVASIPDAPGLSTELLQSLHVYIARSPAQLMMVQWEDLLGLVEQPNLPGTTTQHPNWQRKLPEALETLLRDARVRAIAAAVARERAQSCARPG